ncbi:hypothetical protein [Chryseobacterium indoltheticum]|uniref:hypothetical protein n=1 Tax=Chryseobacterium indoltheticum TaxID=254 RepID=UPI003F49A5A8
MKYGNEGVGGVVVLEPAILPKKDGQLGGNETFRNFQWKRREKLLRMSLNLGKNQCL